METRARIAQPDQREWHGAHYWRRILRKYSRVFTTSDHAACIDLDSWQRPEVFAWLQQAGNISEAEMLSTFNCGLGLLLIIKEQDSATAVDLLRTQGEQPVVVGEIVHAGTPAQPGQLVIA